MSCQCAPLSSLRNSPIRLARNTVPGAAALQASAWPSSMPSISVRQPLPADAAVLAAKSPFGGGDQHRVGVAAIDRDRMHLELVRQPVTERIPALTASRLAKDAGTPALRRLDRPDIDMGYRRHAAL